VTTRFDASGERIAATSSRAAPPDLAEAAGLRYVKDTEAGITRRSRGEAFAYFYPGGRPVRKVAHLERISRLAIPPAWEDVWICRSADGHLQATGRDDRDRKQYLYHERWSEISNLAKFARLHAFGRALPGIRAAVSKAMDEDAPTLHKMCATLVTLLDQTHARVGNEEYARANRSFGLSTLRRKHVVVEEKHVRLDFPSKGGEERSYTVDDPRLVRTLKDCVAHGKGQVFRYVADDGRLKDLDSEQVNDFLGEVAGDAFTAKDFRMWKASALVAGDLFARREEAAQGDDESRAAIVRDALDRAAEALGNTRAVCRAYYVHPVLVEALETGSFGEAVDGFKPGDRKWLDSDEQVLLRVLRHFES
jgi:DNA topoisomerase I